ncbi:MAG: hypothetical protein ABSC94_06925 [Polyangiaceae bacterium]
MSAMRVLFALSLLGTGCATLEANDPEAHEHPPRLEACMVDTNGHVTDAGGMHAMCCPPEYVAGGNPGTSCPDGTCCHISDDMRTPPAMPIGPNPNPRPWGGPGLQ